MFFRNLTKRFRYSGFLVLLLGICSAVIFCVTLTAFGNIISLSRFFSDYQNISYTIELPADIQATDLQKALAESGSIGESLFFISNADPSSSAVIIGIGGAGGWIPQNDIFFYQGDSSVLNTLSSQTSKAFLSSGYYDMFHHLLPDVETISIGDTVYEVCGMADWGFSEAEYEAVMKKPASEMPSIIMPTMTTVMFGYELSYPDYVGSILISAQDFLSENLPIAMACVIFQTPPTKQQYDSIRAQWESIGGVMGAFRQGSRDISIAHINALLCIFGVIAALLLLSGLIRFFLDANADVWRGLFILGVPRRTLLLHMILELLIIDAFAALIMILPGRAMMSALASLGFSVELNLFETLLLAAGCVLIMVSASLPVCVRALRRFTSEEGSYAAA